MTDLDPLLALEAGLARRTSRTRALPLERHLHDPSPLLPPSSSLLTALWQAAPSLRPQITKATKTPTTGAGVSRFRDDPIGNLTFQTMSWIHSHQQFLRWDTVETIGLRQHLATTAQRLCMAPSLTALQASAPAVFNEHARFLRRLITRLAGPTPIEAPGAQYSPDLQLQLLGLDPSQLRGSLLDLGCGSHARLVRHLQRRGVDAWGLDRYADAPGCVVGDWLLNPILRRKRWRCVTSHQGFSLHFTHYHLQAQPDMAIRYAVAYRTILENLPTGGVFAYAPGLPFVESAIDRNHFRITHPTPGTIQVGGLQLPLATQVHAI
ncbi:hypothetical protein KMZ30_19190 [Phycicoccus sp. KQZ13P-1]|uniref:hypothetical protein n=1 Tax=Phycicoccus mangrovi TaxID=2840470 RepID=UPI001C008BB6|nr:hypothetical protein [Phycicoccus mangrovi]MBT9257704.1 hypothetical protein [Phycicoccus mangrovi]